MTTFATLAEKFGIYVKDGVDYTLTQDAYPDTNAGSSVLGGIIMPGQDYYTAQGYDRAGNPVKLVWEITNPDAEDAAATCDWDTFSVAQSWGDPAPWNDAE